MCSLEHPHLARTCSSKEEEAAKLQKDKDEAEKQVNELTEKLSKLFDVNTKSVDDFLALEYYHSDLNDILQAGVKSTEAGHFEADLMEAQTNDKFKSFSSIIASRQYFDGCSEGTHRRFLKENKRGFVKEVNDNQLRFLEEDSGRL